MKKILAYLVAGSLFIGACAEKDLSEVENNIQNTEENPVLDVRRCASADVLETQLRADPSLRARMESVESHTQRMATSGRLNALIKKRIPVVVHVIYKTDAENISLEQIRSQIKVLNEDFNKRNDDWITVPSVFYNRVADMDFRFVLRGVNRKQSNKTSWLPDDSMKKSSEGGLDPVEPMENLNIWVVNKIVDAGKEYLGYAQFPGGNPSTDGVVIGYRYFGNIGTATAPYNKGRTATHEVGHWMNLRHIWGDANCGDDRVSDTPQHDTANFGCPAPEHRSTCPGAPVEMTMNFMDYTDDACMYMFTKEQKRRAEAIFATGGPRASF